MKGGSTQLPLPFEKWLFLLCSRMDYQLEQAATRTLVKLIDIDTEEALIPLYIQPDRAVFLAENAGIVLKVYLHGKTLAQEYATAQKAQAMGVPIPKILLLETTYPGVLAMKYVVGEPLSSADRAATREAGSYLERFHALKACPPFSGGQDRWDEFIVWWATREIGTIETLHLFSVNELIRMKSVFMENKSAFTDRPLALLHGDLQPDHILIEPHTQKVVAFLDFADAQPGDPLLDIAILSLWDHGLAEGILEGYTSIENTEQTQQLFSLYRFLRHIAEVPWLLERGFTEKAEQDIEAIKGICR